jgi:DNA-directed RNA polymerase beta subunit
MNIFYKSFFSQIKTPLAVANKSSVCINSVNNSSFFYSSFRSERSVSWFDLLKKIGGSFPKISKTKINSSKIISNLDKSLSMEYSLDNFHRSNQDTCLVHKPSVFEGQWVQSGDLLADCSASVGGELALGQNILIAYMPWEGYNFEDAILISERLVYDDLYTSIHIERYEVEIRETKLGREEITREIPDAPERSIRHLHRSGIAKLGSWIEEGDILVGKVTPINKKSQSNYQKLLYTILEKPVLPVRDSSLRAPKGIKAKVVGIQIFGCRHNKHILVSRQNQNKVYTRASRKGAKAFKKNSMRFHLPAVAGDNPLPFEGEVRGMKANKQASQKKGWPTQENNNSHQEEGKMRATKNKKLGPPTPTRGAGTMRGVSSENKISTATANSFFSSTEFLQVYSQTNTLFSGNKATAKNKIRSFSYNGFSYNSCLPLFFRNENATKKEDSTNLSFQAHFSLNLPQNRLGEVKEEDKFIFNKDKKSEIEQVQPNGIVICNKMPSSSNTFQLKAINTESLALKSVNLPFGSSTKKKQQSTSKGTIRLRLLTTANFSNKIANAKTKQINGNSQTRKREKGLLNGVSSIQIYLAEKRRIQVGDKMAGRHGNKGIISQILPPEDMPFLPDGTPLDMVLNPLGVPSRMNVGQIYECLLGLAGKHLGENFKVFPFDEIYGAEASRSFVYSKLYNARIKTGKYWLFNPNSPGKMRLYDGRTGESFDQAITVGYAYMLRLVHMVDDKIHCLTADHDVLTTQGWVPVDQVTLGHQVATLKPNGSLVYEHPTKIYNYPEYNGDMYHIKNDNLDLFVTPNHRMYVRNIKENDNSFDGYELLEASSIKGKHKKYLKNAHWQKLNYQFVLPSVEFNCDSKVIPAKVVDMGAWLTLFGLFIAEGCATNNVLPLPLQGYEGENVDPEGKLITTTVEKALYQVQICQNKAGVVEVIAEAATKLGYTYTIVDYKVTVHNKQLWAYLQPLSPVAPLKYLPDWVWSLSQAQARALLHAMCLGDGTWCKNSESYYTSSIKLADDVMRLVLHAGWSANKYFHHQAGSDGDIINDRQIIAKHNLWRISIIKFKNNPSVNHAKKQSAQTEALISNFKGTVHCLSVPNEVFYVRRNGLTVWTGNSRSTGPYSLVTQQPLRGRSKQGGQRLGEMEVWALEGYGAAFTLLEMLTIKSDDMTGRMTLWSNLILNKEISIGTPESFKVLICELQALCLDIGLFRVNSTNNIVGDSQK